MAHASLAETDDYLDEGLEKQYLASLAHGAMKEAAARASSANRRLRDSLRRQSMAQQEAKRKACRRR